MLYNKILVLKSDKVIERRIVSANTYIEDTVMFLMMHNCLSHLYLEQVPVNFQNDELEDVTMYCDAHAKMKSKAKTVEITGRNFGALLNEVHGSVIVCNVNSTGERWPLSDEQVKLLKSALKSKSKKPYFKCYF